MSKREYELDIEKYGENVAPQLPWSVQINPTYGCNRAPLERKFQSDGSCKGGCEFCGVYSLINHDTDTIKFKHMTVELAEQIATQLNNWVKGRRLEFNNFGEPFLNPNIFEILGAFRTNYPSGCIQLQTNGVGSHKSYEKFKYQADKFFESGGNLLVYDAYEGSYSNYVEFGKQYEKETGIQFIDFLYDNPNNVSYYSNHGAKAKMIFVVDDLGDAHKSGSARMINNHAGNVREHCYEKFGIDKSQFPLQKKCSRVFREIIVGFDGTISVCCQDFRRQLILGKIPEDDVRDVWNSREFNTVRALMYDKDRSTLRPCDVCSYAGGFRLGFLKRPKMEVNEDDYKALVELQKKYSNHIHFNGWAEINGTRIDSTMDKC